MWSSQEQCPIPDRQRLCSAINRVLKKSLFAAQHIFSTHLRLASLSRKTRGGRFASPSGGISSAPSGRRPRSQIKLSGSPQRIPQYIEVPPNIEAKQVVLCLSTDLSC